MTEKNLNKLQPKTETPKEKDYPVWQGNENAKDGVTYRNPKSGNLITKGSKPIV